MEEENPERMLINPAFRWTESITQDFLIQVAKCVKNSPESFEKPNPEDFYEHLTNCCSQLEGIGWISMMDKMQEMRKAYIDALLWKEHTDSGILAEGDRSSINNLLANKCPHYDLLHTIFGELIIINPWRKNKSSNLFDQLLLDTIPRKRKIIDSKKKKKKLEWKKARREFKAQSKIRQMEHLERYKRELKLRNSNENN